MWVLPQAGTESKPRFRFKKRGLSTTPCKRVDWMTKFFSFCASGGAFADAETQDVGVSIRKRNRSASRFAPAVLVLRNTPLRGCFRKKEATRAAAALEKPFPDPGALAHRVRGRSRAAPRLRSRIQQGRLVATRAPAGLVSSVRSRLRRAKSRVRPTSPPSVTGRASTPCEPPRPCTARRAPQLARRARPTSLLCPVWAAADGPATKLFPRCD